MRLFSSLFYFLRFARKFFFKKVLTTFLAGIPIEIKDDDTVTEQNTSRERNNMTKTKKMRKYMVYIDDKDYVFKTAIPAYSEQDARNYASGNGEIIMVKDVTDEYPMLSLDISVFTSQGYSEHEADFFVRALRRIGMIDG